jgi:hypothetical protein
MNYARALLTTDVAANRLEEKDSACTAGEVTLVVSRALRAVIKPSTDVRMYQMDGVKRIAHHIGIRNVEHRRRS